MRPHALTCGAKAGFGLVFDVDYQMAVMVGESDEIAFRINHHLLDEGCRLLQQASQEMRFPRAGIALDQQARGQEFRQINAGVGAVAALSENDGCHGVRR
ncbi:hypothetical protein GCM10007866_01060 [Gluconobacter albidus]|uniref:Uncharacterized protein n=1 Tax=Gluconobacter albidus TaxID=318683 RepID=A0ABQ5WVS9_9PROT|nr:hypothetical protein GCM10007866_01060 [Gluconobacter albidus]